MVNKISGMVACLLVAMLLSCSTPIESSGVGSGGSTGTDAKSKTATVNFDNYYGRKYMVFTTLSGDYIVEAQKLLQWEGGTLSVDLPLYDTVLVMNYTVEKTHRDSLGEIYATYNTPKVNKMVVVDGAYYDPWGYIGVEFVDDRVDLLLPLED